VFGEGKDEGEKTTAFQEAIDSPDFITKLLPEKK
jgi:hypothetical protein